MRNYNKIKAWQHSDDLTVAIYDDTKSFPREEVYGLTSQLRRAAYSVPANIAEGSARGTLKDYLHFLYIARASLVETEYFLHLAHRLRYLSEDQYVKLNEMERTAFVLLKGLIGAVEKESGKFKKAAALVTSGLAVCAARLLHGAHFS